MRDLSDYEELEPNFNSDLLAKFLCRTRRHRRLVEVNAPEIIVEREARLVLKAAYEIAGLDPNLLGSLSGDPFADVENEPETEPKPNRIRLLD